MKEYKSKKTGWISIYSDNEHKIMTIGGYELDDNGKEFGPFIQPFPPEQLKRWVTTDIRPIRSKVPTELITKKTKK